MKTTIKIALIALLVSASSSLFAQSPDAEPQFAGEAVLVSDGGDIIPLEKSFIKLTTKANASTYIVGIGKARTRMTVANPESSVRVTKSGDLQFIVRAVDNSNDPLSIISIFQFEKKPKERRAELASASTFGGSSVNNREYIPFTAKKFGESSYLITINESVLEVGEYGITVSNPNNIDEKQTIVSCFGLD